MSTFSPQPAQNVSQLVLLKTRVYTCVFETDTGYLRPVKTGGVEVLRAIYGAVRDKNWDTALFELEVERLEQGEDAFSLEFLARYDQAAIPFWWRGTIMGRGGLLEFCFEGHARAAFLRNRIGLCVLHPIKECAGHCLLANLTGGVQSIELDCLASGLRISGIDEGNLPGAREGRSPAWHPLVTGQERVAFSLSPNALVKLAFP